VSRKVLDGADKGNYAKKSNGTGSNSSTSMFPVHVGQNRAPPFFMRWKEWSRKRLGRQTKEERKN
jgi:hypothetical protein